MKRLWWTIALLLGALILELALQNDPWRAFGVSIVLLIWVALKSDVESGL